MNGNGFSPLEQKGIMHDGNFVKTAPFYTEGSGTARNVRVSPKIREIKSISDYFALLKEIHDNNEKRMEDEKNELGSLFLYRGQGDVNFDYSPTILREQKHIRREHILQKEFHRRFFELMDNCKSLFDEEVIMQHYQVGSRCLDLLENPLMALWAACETESNPKFKDSFGEVSFWCFDNGSDDLKSYDSSTVSIIANTAICKPYFSLGHIEIAYHKEHPTELFDFIYLKDILRRTVVARPKYNNIHFQNQLNCFALMNLNRLVDRSGDFQRKFGLTVERFSDYVLNASVLNKGMGDFYEKPNIDRLRKGFHTLNVDFSNLESWDLWFEKMIPNDSTFVDTFDLYKYQYDDSDSESERVPVYAVISPEFKECIIKELAYANISKAAVYPDMDVVAKEMLEKYALRNV